MKRVAMSESERAAMKTIPKEAGARESKRETRVPDDDLASQGAGKKKGKKTAAREDDPPVVAASQETPPPMSSIETPAKKPPAARTAGPIAEPPAGPIPPRGPSGPEDPLVVFVKNLATIPLPRLDAEHTPRPKDLLPDTGPKDSFAAAAQMMGAGLKSLATWRLVETKSDKPGSEPDPFWKNLKNLASWKAPEPKKKEFKGPSGYEPEPTYKVDLLLSAWTRSHPDRRR
jgi:hypothetical protein